MFQLDSMTKVRVLDVRTLSSKDRKPGDPVGSQLLMRTTLSSQMLGMFDGLLPGMFYRKASDKAQGDLDGIESAELTQIGDHVKRLPWQYEQTGCAVVIDFGTGGPSNITLGDCKAHRVSIAPRQGGSVDVHWTLDAPALATDTRGKLTDLKSTDVQMTMHGPTVQVDAQWDIDDGEDDEQLAPNRKPGAAEKAAANVPVKTAHKPTKDDLMKIALSRTSTAAEARAAAEAAFKPIELDDFPFPKTDGPHPTVTIRQSQPGTRTARGRDKTKAALEAGAADAT